MSDRGKPIAPRSSRTEVDAFLRQVAATPAPRHGGDRGRLLFALDATASREHTWDQAAHLQADMFRVAGEVGGLAIQLCWYRGFMEFAATPWTRDARELQERMTEVRCAAGQTQLGRVLQHAIDTTRETRVNALVFVGDCMEEPPDLVAGLAGELGLLGVPAFVFQEGREPVAERSFRDIARLTRGAWCPFDAGSADQLRDLLKAVAVYAAGGRQALEDYSRGAGAGVRRLTHQLSAGKT